MSKIYEAFNLNQRERRKSFVYFFDGIAEIVAVNDCIRENSRTFHNRLPRHLVRNAFYQLALHPIDAGFSVGLRSRLTCLSRFLRKHSAEAPCVETFECCRIIAHRPDNKSCAFALAFSGGKNISVIRNSATLRPSLAVCASVVASTLVFSPLAFRMCAWSRGAMSSFEVASIRPSAPQ
jgi:hypothetical protein